MSDKQQQALGQSGNHEQGLAGYGTSIGGSYTSHNSGNGWQPMSSAPRDRTIIEVRCTYGVAPWYGLFHWTNKMMVQGQEMTCQNYRWAKVGDECSGFTEDSSFTWRPSAGLVNGSYVDPTGGAQDTPQYWRAAAARSRGLPGQLF